MNRMTITMTLLGLSITAGVANAARYQENSPMLMFMGSWTRLTDMQASDGYCMASTNVGDNLVFQIPGDSFVLHRRVSPDGGIFEVRVDGKLIG